MPACPRFLPTAILATLAVVTGCKDWSKLYCDETTPCSTPDRPYCDLTGEYPASEGIANTCIPTPASGDAGPDATSARLTNLRISAPAELTPAFSPTLTTYAVDVSLFVQEIVVTPTAESSAAVLKVNDQLVESGRASAPIQLTEGTNFVAITVESPTGDTNTYDVVIDRFDHDATTSYVKSPVPHSYSGYGRVAIDDDLLAVAAQTDYPQGSDLSEAFGAVYLYRRNGRLWQFEEGLRRPTPGNLDNFGSDVAISGDTVVIGAAGVDREGFGPNENSGLAYVFRHDGNAWQLEATLSAPNAGEGDEFGSSVAIEGDTLVVGAPGESSGDSGVGGNQADNSQAAAGAAYIFTRHGDAWSEATYVKASNPDAGDRFGHDVDISGGTIVVSAPDEASSATGIDGDGADNAAESAGAVYVFRYSNSTWIHEAYIKAPRSELTHFASVDLDGNSLVVGAPGKLEGTYGSPQRGAAFHYERAGASWRLAAELPSPEQTLFFGGDVSIYGELIAVGAPRDPLCSSAATTANCGVVYLFRTTEGSTPRLVRTLTMPHPDPQDNFGEWVALDRAALVAGAPGEDGGSAGVGGDEQDETVEASGAVFVFH